MPNIIAAVSDHDDDISDLVGYQDNSSQFFFDVKLSEIFRRKARFVADRHKIDTP